MIFQNRYYFLVIAAFVLLWGCSGKDTGQKHKTWFDLVEINDKIIKAKETAGPDASVDEEQDDVIYTEVAPRIRDLSMQDDTDNRYLKGVIRQKTFNTGEAIEGEGVMLNFDNADIYEVIQVIAETLELSYIIDPQVKGVVNIRSGSKIPKSQLFVIFKKLLNINGLDIRNEGGHEYIFVSGKPSPLAIYDQNQIGELKESSRLITQIVPVMHMSSAEAQKLVEPYLSEHSVIYNLADHNLLIISDFEGQIIDALMILAQIDVSSMSSLIIRLVRVDNAPLYDLRDELTEILLALKINKKDHAGVQILPLERVNALLLIGYNESLLRSAIKWIDELDQAPNIGRDNIFIYNVRNSMASELTELVSSLIEDKSSKKKTTSKSTSSKSKTARLPGSMSKSTGKSSTASSTKSGSSPRTSSGTTSSSMQFAGEPTLIADDARNIILIRALFADYKRLMKLLERLDNLPMQVLIEVMVAEVTLSDDLSYGVEWALKKNQTSIVDAGFTFNASGGNDTTFSLSNLAGDNVFKLLSFLASNNDVTILSSPQVLVLNNESATVNVGQQVPVVTSETSDTTATTTSNRTVQYKDAGVVLNVTPRINYDGIILLEIDQQVNSVLSLTTVGIDSPTFSTKQLKTKLAVKDGQSILMGGLINKTDTITDSGIPFLKDVPGLGWLFKSKSIKHEKTELLIMVTPYVIESEDVLDQYIRSFKEKMIDLRKELDRMG